MNVMIDIAIATPFERSVNRQIAVNQSRSATERFSALCDLLDLARAMAPQDEAARVRRHRALAARQRDREQWRDQCRQFLASQRIDAEPGI
jgi:hypothetical protein